MISDKKPVQDFVSLLVRHGIRHVIITPGSRNAPFIISLHNHPEITAHSVVDERSAAFIALGMAQQWKHTVALICTSGTAALNFAPAIAEAMYQRVPLLIVTADRPMEWIDQGEGQSIRQRNLYRNYAKASYEIAGEIKDTDLNWYNVRQMDEAMRLCMDGVHGPVHINFPLRESLYQTVAQTEHEVKVINRAVTEIAIEDTEFRNLSTQIAASDKVMVLAGQMPPDSELRESLVEFSANENVIVMTEAHSNLAHLDFITTIDRLIMGFDDEEKKFIVPDILITIGHNIISRKIKAYLRNGRTEHWHVDVSGEGLDTFKNLRKVIPVEPKNFFKRLSALNYSSTSTYKKSLSEKNTTARQNAVHYLKAAHWSDLKAIDEIMQQIPQAYDVQMGNSSLVRYILLSDSREDLSYFGNRGVAGIDGCTSTAVGASFASGRPSVLISGDIAFLYDSNAFWNELLSPKLKIIVINNAGGGIFRIIPGPDTTGDALEKFFETHHQRKAEGLAAMYGLKYKSADEDSLQSGLNWLFENESCAVLEVFTPRMENDRIQKEYFNYLKENK